MQALACKLVIVLALTASQLSIHVVVITRCENSIVG